MNECVHGCPGKKCNVEVPTGVYINGESPFLDSRAPRLAKLTKQNFFNLRRVFVCQAWGVSNQNGCSHFEAK